MRRTARPPRPRHAWSLIGAAIFAAAYWALIILMLTGRP